MFSSLIHGVQDAIKEVLHPHHDQQQQGHAAASTAPAAVAATGVAATSSSSSAHVHAPTSGLFATALFFPDEKLPCRSLEQGKTCTRPNCDYSHTPTSLFHIQTYLRNAKTSIDVCVFSITCDELANELLAAHQRGVVVRIIADDDQCKTQGSDVVRLAQAGVPARTDNSPFHMHNKYCVIDNTIIINGSFNWTRQAVLNNRENVVVSNDPVLVTALSGEFLKLWNLYANNAVH